MRKPLLLLLLPLLLLLLCPALLRAQTPGGAYTSPSASSATSASLGALGPLTNVANYISLSAASQSRFMVACVTFSSGSALISSTGAAGCTFSQADVGLTVDGYLHGDSSSPYRTAASTTILSVQSTTMATLSKNATASAAGNAGSLALYTDQSTGIQNAVTAACASISGVAVGNSGSTQPAELYFPAGIYSWLTPPTASCAPNITVRFSPGAYWVVPPRSSWSGHNYFPLSGGLFNMYGILQVDGGQYDFAYTATNFIEFWGSHIEGVNVVDPVFVTTGGQASAFEYIHGLNGAGASVFDFTVRSNVTDRPLYLTAKGTSVFNPNIGENSSDCGIKAAGYQQTISNGTVVSFGSTTADICVDNQGTQPSAISLDGMVLVPSAVNGIDFIGGTGPGTGIIDHSYFTATTGAQPATWTSLLMPSTSTHGPHIVKIANSTLEHGSGAGVDINFGAATNVVIDGGGNSCNHTPCTFSGSGGFQGSVTIIGSQPSIASGFGTSPSIVANSLSPDDFSVNIGGGGAATSGVLTMPPAVNGWRCTITSQGSFATPTTAAPTSSTSVTLTTTVAWSANLVLNGSCKAY